MLATRHILALGYLPGITSSVVRRIIERCSSFEWIAGAPPDALAALGMRRAAIQAVASLPLLLERADRQIERSEQIGARIVQIRDGEYPSRLREIYSAPVTLYVRGRLPAEEERVAIVGTRGATMYGRSAAEEYAEAFVSAGIAVTSGLARGIDQYAHAAALRAGGRTIAVVAAGLDEISPTASARIAEQIVESGAVVSEYPFGVKAIPAYFPQRNRIISGLSSATLVIESDERGGAMITAGFALDQNREVFALPGPIISPKSRGPNHLIRTDRARLTQSPRDMLEALGYHLPPPATMTSSNPIELSLFEQQLYEALGAEPVHVDDLCDASGLSSSEALVNLLSLEFKGMVRQLAGKMFLKKTT